MPTADFGKRQRALWQMRAGLSRTVARLADVVDAVRDRIPGPTAMFYGKGDVVETSKVLKAFIKSKGKPVIKLGALQGKLISRKR